MSFLSGLGSIAGGINQSNLFPAIEQYKTDTAVGQYLYAAAGVSPPGQQGQGQQGQGQQGMGALISPPPQAPQQAPTPTPAPSLGQGGTARSPMPQPSQAPPIQAPQAPPIQAPQAARLQAAPPQAPPQVAPQASQPPPTRASFTPAPTPTPSPSGLAPGAPTTARPGVSAPGPQAAQTGPTGTDALAQQQQSSPSSQQPQGKGFDAARYASMFDMPTIVGNLLKTPGMNPTKLGRIVRSEGFKTVLNQEGLQQYRALNLMLGQERIGLGQERIDQSDRRQASLDKYRGGLMDWRKQALGYGSSTRAIMQEARTKISAINAAVGRGDLDQKEAQKQIDAINNDMDEKLKNADKGLSEPPQGESDGSADSAPLDEAKAAIEAGAPRDKVIERFKRLHPELDASGL